MEKILDIFFYIWYDFIGYASCHQLTERTLSFDGTMFFVCYRCSGIYAGYVLSYIYIYLGKKHKAVKLPSRKIVFTGILFGSLMFFDVF